MILYNYSNIQVDRSLIKKLTEEFFLSGILPRHQTDDLGFYDTSQLIIVIKEGSDNDTENGTVVGDYVFGRLNLYTCDVCSSNYIYLNLMHELIHAFIDQCEHHSILNPPSKKEEMLANKFSSQLFSKLYDVDMRLDWGDVTCNKFGIKKSPELSQKFISYLHTSIKKILLNKSYIPRKSKWANELLKQLSSPSSSS